MHANVAEWSLVFLCFSLAAAFGGGLFEHIVVVPIWRASPPSSFAIIQRGTGRTAATVLDSRACGHHGVHAAHTVLDVA